MRPRSLFTRVLVAQVLMAIVLPATLAALFYVERNLTVSQLVASVWSPTLRQLARHERIEDVRARAPGPLHVSATRPDRVFEVTALSPRLAMVREQLLAQGVPITEAMLGLAGSPPGAAPVVWLELSSEDGTAHWVGIESSLVEARLGGRVILAALLVFGLAIVFSAVLARRIAKPLEALRMRIAADDASGGPLPMASSEVVAIDDAWRLLRRSLEQQERERALLLAGVSHDLRSPLARIRMAAELLPDLDSVAAERDAIVRNTQIADRLVGSFLDHVRSGELPLNEKVDVAAVARHVAALQQRPSAELTVEAPAALWVSNAHADLLERAMANLLDNAFAHGRQPVLLRVAVQDAKVCIDVKDHGPGIHVEQQEVLLQAFARADESRRRPGLGLGLAVVHRVAMRMGGGVTFWRSADGVSNVVRMYWPEEDHTGCPRVPRTGPNATGSAPLAGRNR